ncbi:hypothetical protein [Rhodovarius lipocyclicus]|uniref:hypothetical protein n=1 Tax=Rhodovarius lipocyclicus TaxID=268410 RepID=UPI001358EB1B|nr:hypothetical protein [Rhodovarius lipocyclicus]
MSGARMSPPRSTMVAEPPQAGAGNVVLFGLRVVLMGCVVALGGVLVHVAWKIISA